MNIRLSAIKINRYAIVAFCIVAWGYYVLTEHMNIVNEFFVPSYNALREATQKMFWKEHFLVDIGYSTWRVWVAYLFSFVVWLPLALLMSFSVKIRKTLLPYVDFFRYIPVPTLIPISILLFGIGEWSKLFLLIAWTLFQLILIVLNDLDTIPKAYYHLAKSLWWTGRRIVVMKVKAILPALYDSSRIMIGWCWTYVVIAELVAAQHGVWFVIKEAQRFANTPKIYIAILSMWIVWFVTDYVLRKMKPLVFPYTKWLK